MTEHNRKALAHKRFQQFFRKILALGAWYTQKRNPAWAMPIHLPASDNFYAVNTRLFRAAQPTAQAFTEYERLGLKTVLQLCQSNDDRPLLGHTALNLIRVPMRTGLVTDEHMIRALKLIQSEPGPILIHCHHGADRTGLVVALYRILFEGWSREAALEEMLYGGYGFHHRKRQNMVKYLKEADIDTLKKSIFDQ